MKTLDTICTPARCLAAAEVHDRTSIYRQGRGWIVSTWSEQYRASELSHEMPWPMARAALSLARRHARLWRALARAGSPDAAMAREEATHRALTAYERAAWMAEVEMGREGDDEREPDRHRAPGLSNTAYTRAEWDTASSADYERTPDGWLFQGQPFTGSVRRLR